MVSREHMMDPNMDTRASWAPIVMWSVPKWNTINKDLNFSYLPSTRYVSSCEYLAPCPQPSGILWKIGCFWYSCVVTDHIYLYIQSPVNCSMDTCLNCKNDALHTTYHTPHTVSATIQQPRNITGPRLGQDSWQNEHSINTRSTGASTCQAKIQWGLKTLVRFVCSGFMTSHPLILCAFLPTLCGPELVRCAISPSPHYTYLVPVSIHCFAARYPGPGSAVGTLYWQSCPFHRYRIALEWCKLAILARLNPMPPYLVSNDMMSTRRYPACTWCHALRPIFYSICHTLW